MEVSYTSLFWTRWRNRIALNHSGWAKTTAPFIVWHVHTHIHARMQANTHTHTHARTHTHTRHILLIWPSTLLFFLNCVLLILSQLSVFTLSCQNYVKRETSPISIKLCIVRNPLIFLNGRASIPYFLERLERSVLISNTSCLRWRNMMIFA